MQAKKLFTHLQKTVAASVALLTLLTSLSLARPIGLGDHYFFELDEDGWSIIEPGEFHRKIYVSYSTGSDTNDGLTELTPRKTIKSALKLVREGSSDWVLLKRGDTFPNTARFDRPGQLNELGTADDPLHPQIVGAYGTGPRPILQEGIRHWFVPLQNLVFRDLNFEIASTTAAIDFLSSSTNILFENVRVINRGGRIQGDHVRTTFYRCSVIDVHRDLPGSSSGQWGDDYTQNHQNRESGLYVTGTTGFYMRECVFDRNGWEEGYNAIDGGDPTDPQPPSMFSHNLYTGPNNTDMTLADNFTTRGASMGFKMVAPGVVSGNVVVGNNLAMGINDGDQESADLGGGDVLILRDNVVLHASDKNATWIGARGWGLTMGESDTIEFGEAIRNIEAHSTASGSTKALSTQSTQLALADLVLDNVVYNYGTTPDLDPDPGNPYTDPTRDIISYNVSVGGAASLEDFYDEIRALERDNWNPDYLAKNVVAYLQEGFDIGLTPRSATTVTFTGNTVDGARWDNPDNWSTLDLPGTVTGDRATINGDYVNFSDSVTLSYLTLSNGAELDLFQGSLYLTDVNSLRTSGTGGVINLGRTGKLSWDRYFSSSPFTINMTGGELHVRGRIHNGSDISMTLNISGGRAILAGNQAWSNFSNGRSLNITGTKARVGWRDGGTNYGNIEFGNGGILSFTFDELGVSPVDQIDGGAVNAWFTISDGAELHIDLTGLTDLAPGSYTNLLVNADSLRGTAGEFDVENITGVGMNGITAATVEYDTVNDEILLHVTVEGPPLDPIDFGSAGNFSGFDPGSQDLGTVTVSSDGGTNNVAKLADNAWKTFGITETIDSTTRVRFSLKVTGSPEIVGIALGDSGDTVINDIIGQGVQLYGDGVQDTWFHTSAKNTSVADWYAGAGAYVQYDMLVSDFASPGSYTKLIFVADDDAGTDTEVFIKDIEFY